MQAVFWYWDWWHENSNIDVLKPYIGDYDENRVKFLVCQEHEDEIADSVEIIKGLIDYASKFEREPISVSKLVIGMKCGGSDGLSGITANPLVGRFSDLLISKGGTTILTEVPEMFGAETILMNRCANEELFHQTVDLINDFKNYFKSHNQTIYENPSPGNKKGGISTLEDKSLGCTQKSGSALVKGVLQYGDTVKTPGLNLLSAPGNDLVAATALAAAGAHIVLFTTGRGTPFASPVPTMKIATNSRLAGKKSNWIDFNAGVLVEDKTMEEETKALFDLVVETASGRQVCSEATHNVKTALGDLLEYTYNPTPVEEKKTEDVTFMGFNRPDGKVGVRNEIWVIPTVGCVNNVATAIAKQANAFVKGSVEEVIAFPHPYGCSQMGDDQEHTRKILADLINHPNAGGVLVLGLGCENSNIDVLKPYIGDYDENRVKFLVCQEHEDEIADSVEVIKGLIDYASKFEREPISVSKLVIGMKCGGSDGLSGITANPLVGRFSDLLISKGGTTILTEVPEMFGAETILMNRCANEELFHQTVDLINDFKNYFKSHNQTIYENPSRGNKKGGISTLRTSL